MDACSKHGWNPEPGSLQWRCPLCAADTVPKKSKTKATGGGSADVRLPGYTRMKRNERIRERDGYCCQKCGRPEAKGEIDHIVPLKDGGTEADANCQLLCVECHKDKSRADMGLKPKPYINTDGAPDGWK
jgi:5-methylcytosine-specific restriction enzyme A